MEAAAAPVGMWESRAPGSGPASLHELLGCISPQSPHSLGAFSSPLCSAGLGLLAFFFFFFRRPFCLREKPGEAGSRPWAAWPLELGQSGSGSARMEKKPFLRVPKLPAQPCSPSCPTQQSPKTTSFRAGRAAASPPSYQDVSPRAVIALTARTERGARGRLPPFVPA